MKLVKLNVLIIAAIYLFINSMQSSCTQKKIKESNVRQSASIPAAAVEIPKMDIHTATIMGNYEVIKQHIEAGTDINSKEPTRGSSPLITASVFGRTEVAKVLIDAGANINQRNNDGSTALHTSAFFGRVEIVKKLIAMGADTSVKNNFGSTALETVSGPFEQVKPIYDQFSRDLGPFGFELDYKQLIADRAIIASLLQSTN